VNSYTGNTQVCGGVLRADLGVGLPGTLAAGPTANLSLRGGAWETENDINLPLGVGAGQVQLPAGLGPSGFSAYGPSSVGPLNVKLAGGALLQWAITPSFSPDALVLQGPWANRPLNFLNSIDLNGMTRTITVNADPATPMYDPQSSTPYPNVAPATISGMIVDSGVLGGAGLTKDGPGILVLANIGNNYNGQTTISGGVLRAVDGFSSPANGTLPAASNLSLDGGVFETSGTFTRGLGFGANQIWMFGGTVGFSAWDTTAGATVVALGGLAAPTSLVWDTAGFHATPLRLNDLSANGQLIFKNNIDLNGADREINVRAARDNSTRATITGNITGIWGERLTKSGQGVLELTGNNTYNGPTTVTGGVLRAVDRTVVANGSLSANNLLLEGGVLETGYDFVRSPGTGAGQVQLYAEPPDPIAGGNNGMQYPSGFSAHDPASGGYIPGALTVALGGTTAPIPLTWDPTTAFCPNPLILNAETANAPLVFMNPIDLNNMSRQVDVNSPSQPATMSGKLSGGGSLIKGGSGELILIAVNSYIGGTTIN
jgi:autotransporter-associated beta strand protein